MSETASDRIRVCRNCYDYANEHALIFVGPSGWEHYEIGERCGGQEDDDTDDRAEPMWLDREDAVYLGIIEDES